MSTTPEVSTTTPMDGVTQTVVIDTGGVQLPDPAIVAADAAALAASTPGPVVPLPIVTGTFNGTDGGTQTVTNY